MTEVLDALADTTPDADARRTFRVAAAIYEASLTDQTRGWQRRLSDATGVSRETIRKHVEDEKIRRGLISPTPRYLRTQAALARKRARASGS